MAGRPGSTNNPSTVISHRYVIAVSESGQRMITDGVLDAVGGRGSTRLGVVGRRDMADTMHLVAPLKRQVVATLFIGSWTTTAVSVRSMWSTHSWSACFLEDFLNLRLYSSSRFIERFFPVQFSNTASYADR